MSTEHDFKRIKKDIKTDSIKSPLFFFGREDYLIKWAIDSIVDKYIDPSFIEMNFSLIDSSDITFLNLMNQCETLPIMSSRRVVVVEDFYPLAGQKLKGFSDDDEIDLADYLKRIPETCILIFTGKTADKRRKLYKTINQYGSCYEFKELDVSSLRKFIRKRFNERGKSIKPSLVNQIIEMSGYYDKESDYTLYNLDNDLRKVIAHSKDEEIKADDVINCISGNIEKDIFAMIDALSLNKKDEAFSLLHNLLSSGNNIFKILALICMQFETILFVKEHKEEGYSLSDINKELGIHEYRVKKASMFANRYSLEQLQKALSLAYQVEKNIKEGILDSRLALEMLISQV
ncbi:MAG: DNA polymerase III subunit delta [Clostridiales bacterium]|nr:DNA polymerase III subunit delta [Clostridiales bacterium]